MTEANTPDGKPRRAPTRKAGPEAADASDRKEAAARATESTSGAPVEGEGPPPLTEPPEALTTPDPPADPFAAGAAWTGAAAAAAASAAGASRPPPQAPPMAMAMNEAQMKAIEELSVNLARAAMIAQGAVAEAALQHADRPQALSADPFHVGPALTQVMGKLASQPDRMLRAQADLYSRYMNLWQNTAKRAMGEPSEPVVAPERGDKRFADAEWSENPVFDAIKQSYLLSANWLNGLVGGVEDVDPTAKRRVEFFTKMLTDAFAPPNFLMSNPAALREAVATKGESLVKGMENFASDLQRGRGELQISQSDSSKFEVGVNVATAPGKVVFQNELIQLLQFEPQTEKVHALPLLIFPPWINKYYILDLRPENSMIRWLSSQGFTVFVVSWVNPGPELAGRTFEDYLLGAVYPAIEQAMVQTGQKQVNTVGYCIGGTMLACALAHMAAKGVDAVASATFFAAQQDFAEAGDLRLFTDEDWLRVIEVQMENAGGVLPGQAMAGTFNSLRANDLIWSFFVSNYLLGKEPKAFDLLFWNSDQTRMPKALHLFYLRRFYQENALAKGELVLAGERLDLGKVKIPVYAQSSKEDHIAPARSVYRSLKLFGGPATFTMAGSGHIAGVINHPAATKYQHWTHDALPGSLEGWTAEAQEQPGSWWPHWASWLADKSGPMVDARDPATGPLKPLEDAPGAYVKVKS